jgi:acetate kinase
MKILVINSGSSSVKFKLFDMTNESVIAEGNCQRVGLADSELKFELAGGKKQKLVEDLPDHTAALRRIFELLTTGETRVLESMDELDAIGHRFSMGGLPYKSSILIDDAVLEAAEGVVDITPLHSPPQIKGVRVCRELLGDKIPMVAGLDVAFHTTIPKETFLYPIPYRYFEKYNVRKYGFHGLSHQFVVERYAELTGKALEGTRIVTCHLGGGSSITAVQDGKSIDNTFGFGTGEGPGCGSRAGTVDHVMLGYLMQKEGLSYSEMEDILHRESGLLGVSGISSDEKELEDLAAEGNERAQLALDILARQLKKYIGSYAFEMGGLDTIIFTGGIGENSDVMRAMITDGLEAFGVDLDKTANVELNRKEAKISAPGSRVEIWTIPTNEELMIAEETKRLVEGK